MKVGLISDIHSNEQALKSVLDDMPSIDKLVCCGDIIGYGPSPKECLDLVKTNCDVILQGNHDREVAHQNGAYSANEMAHEGLKHSRKELSKREIEFLQSLPPTVELSDKALLAHSHPEYVDRYVHAGNFSDVSTYMGDSHNYLIFGHTHQQHAVEMSKFNRHGVVLNPGSVGQPRDDDPRAAYATIDLYSEEYEFHRVSYDIKKVQYKIRERGLPIDTGKRLTDGR